MWLAVSTSMPLCEFVGMRTQVCARTCVCVWVCVCVRVRANVGGGRGGEEESWCCCPRLSLLLLCAGRFQKWTLGMQLSLCFVYVFIISVSAQW